MNALSCPQAMVAVLLVVVFIIYLSRVGSIRWVPVLLYSLVYIALVAMTCRGYPMLSWVLVAAPLLLPFVLNMI